MGRMRLIVSSAFAHPARRAQGLDRWAGRRSFRRVHRMRDYSYPAVIWSAKAAFRALDLRFQVSGTDRVPRRGGALLAFNHVSYVDFILGGYAAHPAGRLVRFMAKREVFDHPVSGPLMRSMHHISVDRRDGVP